MTATLPSSARTTTGPLPNIEGLEVRYGAALALQDVSLSLDSGQVLAVVGPNGAGKSTLARVISGLIPAKHGTITFKGEKIANGSPDRIRKSGVVHLPEGRGVFTSLSVDENLRMATGLIERGERKAAIERAYEIFPPLATRRRQAAGTLSGGEQQMLSLARALVVKPELIIADEMSLGLAPLMVDLVFESLARARDEGIAIILIEQFVHRALAFADFCAVISRGKTVWQGAATEAKDEVLRRFLGGGEV